MAAANQGNGAHMGTTETRALRDARARWRKRDARAERALGRLLLWLALGLMAACATELTPGAYRCEPGLPGQCPAGWGCQVRAGTEEGRCYPDGATCGDGILGSGEECDGLALSEEAACPAGGLPFCTSACRLACTTCGNGVLEATPAGPREECDDGNLLGGDGCSASCLLPRCGDGVLDLELFEECDDGAGNSNIRPGACRLSCRRARCSDGVVDAPRETCDDGNLLGGDGCNATCNSNERCGNGFIDTPFGETCDDANFLSHDGCSSSCKKEELGWSAIPVRAPRRPNEGEIFDEIQIYDPTRQLMVIYGGVTSAYYGGSQEYDETYEANGSSHVLRHGGETIDIGTPSQRKRHQLVYDSKRGVVFRIAPEGIFAWTGQAWLPERFATADPVDIAFSFSIAHDSRRGVSLFATWAGLWEWDSATHIVRRVNSIGGILVFEPRVGKVLRIGEMVSEWDPASASWIEVADGPPYGAAAAAYDVSRGYVVVVDWGETTSTWDHRRLQWTTYGDTPCYFSSTRYDLAYDDHRRAVVYGSDEGCGSKMWNGSTWEPPSSRSLPVAAPLASSLTVQDHTRAGYWILPLGTPAPAFFRGRQDLVFPALSEVPPELPWSAVTDEYRRRVVVWIGGDAEKETWEWDTQAWSRKAASGATPKFPLGSLHYDPARQRVLLVARQSGELWSWDGAVWTQLVAPGPLTLDFHVVYDRRRQRLMRIGSTGFTLEVQELEGNRWLRIANTANPGELMGEPWYDIPRQRVVAVTFAGTWEWDGADWHSGTSDSLVPAGLFSHATGLTVVHGSEPRDFGYQTPIAASEFCPSGLDADHDSLVGCADPDCWPYCTPGCLPGETCAPGLPHCGDSVCDSFTETCRMCPRDCGACTAECGDFLCDPGETAATCPGDCP